MNNAITVLKSEHRSLSAVLQALIELARMAQDPKVQPDWRPFRAMLRYIDEYPERLHHPKEDQFLFARLAKRSPDARRRSRASARSVGLAASSRIACSRRSRCSRVK